MRRDLASAYVATAARLGSWVIVLGLVYRTLGAEAMGLLALVRGTLAILNYSALGLAPALVHLLAQEKERPVPALPVAETVPGTVLSYAARLPPAKPVPTRLQVVYYSGLLLVTILCGLSCLLLWLYAGSIDRWLKVPTVWTNDAPDLVAWFGAGVLLRLISDAPGAVLQTSGRIATDNLLLASAEFVWVALTVWVVISTPAYVYSYILSDVGVAFFGSGLFLLAGRMLFAEAHARLFFVPVNPDVRAMRQMLGFGLAVALAQVADYLYAPVDYILINRLIDPATVAVYAPAIQIDAGLFVLVSGLAAVLFPKGALAHAAGDLAALRRYYIRGTLASLAILIPASVIVYFTSPWIFRLWFGDEMKATQAILWLMLLNVCIGGSAMVGRSILLAMGKVKLFTASVLIAGVLNVILSYTFVRYLNWGLYGIILGTVVAVVLRCALWMPWYVLRSIRTNDPTLPPIHPSGTQPTEVGY